LEKVRLLIKPFGRKSLLLILTSVLLLTAGLSVVASAQTNKDNKRKIIRQVAQNYIRAGAKLYGQGQYKQAEKYFLRALDDQECLTASERKELNELLEKAHSASMERKSIAEHIQTAEKLIKQDEFAKAKTHLEKVKDSKFLTQKERNDITAALGRLAKLLPEEKRRGELSETDTAAVEDELLRLVGKPVKGVRRKIVEEPNKPAPVGVSKPVQEKGAYIEMVNRQRKIRQHYAAIIVNDANEKAQTHISRSEFEQAKDVVDKAKRTVDDYQLDLGDALYKQYTSKLKELSDEIAQTKEEETKRLEAQRLRDAIEAQERFRKQAEADRKKRIEDLMKNAMDLQKKQKYTGSTRSIANAACAGSA